METTHEVVVGDARDLALPEDSVELVVTSPPYPMIEMWDGLFSDLDPEIGERLASGDGRGAFAAMHAILDDVWAELRRVLVPGGIACVNVGDATRTVDGNFRVYGNHSRIGDAFEDLDFSPLPEVLWRKPVNSGTKFMGSGMIPPNAYVTLEHEYVLVFRNGRSRRSFEPGADRRYEAAYFWEERNDWFSDLWTDVTGEGQALDWEGSVGDDAGGRGGSAGDGDGDGTGDGASGEGEGSGDDQGTDGDPRDRSGAYPFAVPYRLVNMYSAYGDTVLDPFWGTGTTTLAAMVAGRNSVGYELEPEFAGAFEGRVEGIEARSREIVERRLADHRSFVEEERESGEELGYEAEHYDFPVRTKQERRIRFYEVDHVEETEMGYRAVHTPVEDR